jgi:sec-independent protein translocase protein TatB
MFGMGFTEILLVLVVAIIFLGPDKLPTAAADVAKIFKKIKGSVDEVKSSINDELHVNQLKEETKKIQSQISSATNIKEKLSIDELLELDDNQKSSKEA